MLKKNKRKRKNKIKIKTHVYLTLGKPKDLNTPQQLLISAT